MSVAVLDMRTNFREFADINVYPDDTINFYLAIAALRLNAQRWSTLLDYGTQLFVAHNLVLSARNVKATLTGGLPGQAQGVMTAKGVDKASASYDANSVSLTNQGYWGSTSYGIQFLQMARDMGAGGLQLGAPITVFPWPLA